MREIEFRGKSKRTGKWVRGNLIIKRQKMSVSELDKELFRYRCSIQYLNKKGNYSITEVTLETVGQYTGLRDKNRVKIYDGDILDYDGDLWIVDYEEDDGMFTLTWEDVTENFSNMNSKWFEVISNIHDNPELLKED